MSEPSETITPIISPDGQLGEFLTASSDPERAGALITHKWRDRDEHEYLKRDVCPECEAPLTEFDSDDDDAMIGVVRSIRKTYDQPVGMIVHGVCVGCSGHAWYTCTWVSVMDMKHGLSTLRSGYGHPDHPS